MVPELYGTRRRESIWEACRRFALAEASSHYLYQDVPDIVGREIRSVVERASKRAAAAAEAWNAAVEEIKTIAFNEERSERRYGKEN